MKKLFFIATILTVFFTTIHSDAQTVSDSTKTIQKKYQAKAPSTQSFGAGALGPSNKTTIRWLGMAGFLFMPGPEIMVSKTGICITSYRENIRTLLPHRNHSHELKMAESI